MNFIEYTPETNLKIISSKSPDEAIDILRSQLNDTKSGCFEGDLKGCEFNISHVLRDIEGDFIYPLEIKGVINKHTYGSEIALTMKIKKFTFLSYVCSYIFLIIVSTLLEWGSFIIPSILFLLVIFANCSYFHKFKIAQMTKYLKKFFVSYNTLA